MPCPHCGDLRLRNEDPAQSWTYEGEQCTLLRCASCQGMWSHPLPTPALLKRLYRDVFNYRWYQDHYPAKLIDALHRILQYRRLGVLRQGDRILDFGGGVGYFSAAARLLGYEAVTRDPVYEDNDAPPAAGDFDLVACHHVLEHAIDPGALLAQVRPLLAPGGRLIMAVPNAGSQGYLRRGVHWVWSQPPFIHIHHFTERGLRTLLGRAGFLIDDVHWFERWDANALADLRLVTHFARWDADWGSAWSSRAQAQVHSLRRYLALALSPLLAPLPRQERAELLFVARRGDAP